MAIQFTVAVEAVRRLYFEGGTWEPALPLSFAGQSADSLPHLFRTEVDEFTRFFAIRGTGKDWYPDIAFTDVHLFDQVTSYLAAAARSTGRLDEFLKEPEAPAPGRPDEPTRAEDPEASECAATDVAGNASVNPTELGPHVQVAGHGMLAWHGDGGGRSPLSGLRGALPI